MRRALVLLGLAAAVIAAGGAWLAASWHLSYWHGLYCSLGQASTDGCDASARGPAGWIAASAIILAAVPLLAAAFASLHLDRVDERLRRHHKAIHDRLDQIGGGGDAP